MEKTPITYYSEKEGNDCYVCTSYLYHRGYIVVATSDTAFGGSPDVEITTPRELYKWVLMYDLQLSKWVERMILENE